MSNEPASAEVREGRDIHIENDSGRTRLLVRVEDDGEPVVLMLDDREEIRGYMKFHPGHGVTTKLVDPIGKTMVCAGTKESGSALITVFDQDGHEAVEVDVGKDWGLKVKVKGEGILD